MHSHSPRTTSRKFSTASQYRTNTVNNRINKTSSVSRVFFSPRLGKLPTSNFLILNLTLYHSLSSQPRANRDQQGTQHSRQTLANSRLLTYRLLVNLYL